MDNQEWHLRDYQSPEDPLWRKKKSKLPFSGTPRTVSIILRLIRKLTPPLLAYNLDIDEGRNQQEWLDKLSCCYQLDVQSVFRNHITDERTFISHRATVYHSKGDRAMIWKHITTVEQYKRHSFTPVEERSNWRGEGNREDFRQSFLRFSILPRCLLSWRSYYHDSMRIIIQFIYSDPAKKFLQQLMLYLYISICIEA